MTSAAFAAFVAYAWSPAVQRPHRCRVVGTPRHATLGTPRHAATRLCSDGNLERDEASRFLGLDCDRDVEKYLVSGMTLLGKRVALLLPDDLLLAESLLVAAKKMVKLGATTILVADSRQRHKPRIC